MTNMLRIFPILILWMISLAVPCSADTSPPLLRDAEQVAPEGASKDGPGFRPESVRLGQVGATALEEEEGEVGGEEEVVGEISDPLEGMNRAFFTFNDKVYFWVLKPVARGYKGVFPEPLRIAIGNFFSNLATPIRAANCLLQADLKGTGTELLRFGINTVAGVAGFGDAGKEVFGIDKRRADLGQTLGVYGLGPGIYINWPFLGPSSVRESFGFAGDLFLDPITYVPFKYAAGARGTDRVNSTSLTIGQYESLKKAALDPYIALRNAFHQYRVEQVRQGIERSPIR